MNKNISDENIPRYKVKFDKNKNQGVKRISLVKYPAIEIDGKCFSKFDDEQYNYKKIEDQQIIVGPFMVPNVEIKRKSKSGELFYVSFDAETIKEFYDDFNQNRTNKDINMDHENNKVPGYIQGQWMVEDSNYDKSKFYGYDMEPGSWFGEWKITNSDYWQKDVIDAGRNSFSIEGFMDYVPQDYFEQIDETYEKYHNFIDSLEYDNPKSMEYLYELYNKFVVIEGIETHPNCRCQADKYIWVCQKDACNVCRAVQKEYNTQYLSGNFEVAKAIFEKHTGRKFNS